MAKSVKKFASKGFFQTVDLELLERLLDPHAAGLPFALSDLPEDEKERRRALHDHFLAIDEGFPDELLDALHCILQLSDSQGLRCLHERADLSGVQLVPPEETEGEHDGRLLALGYLRLRARRQAKKANKPNHLRSFGLDFAAGGSVCDTDDHADRELR
jgi:hypothetical protein